MSQQGVGTGLMVVSKSMAMNHQSCSLIKGLPNLRDRNQNSTCSSAGCVSDAAEWRSSGAHLTFPVNQNMRVPELDGDKSGDRLVIRQDELQQNEHFCENESPNFRPSICCFDKDGVDYEHMNDLDINGVADGTEDISNKVIVIKYDTTGEVAEQSSASEDEGHMKQHDGLEETHGDESQYEPLEEDGTQEEVAGEQRKFSKSYWRKQRRLRLKERLLAEKLLMESNPELCTDERESLKPQKGIKSKGK